MKRYGLVLALVLAVLFAAVPTAKLMARMTAPIFSGGGGGVAAPTLYDSYTDMDGLDYEWLWSGLRIRACQSFNSATAATLHHVDFYAYRALSPSGDATATLYAHSGTYGSSSVGTGTALATSDAVTATSIGTSAGWVTFTFTGANKYALAGADTKYVLCMEFAGGTTTDNLRCGADWTSPTHGGNYASYYSSWSYDAGGDVLFRLYVD